MSEKKLELLGVYEVRQLLSKTPQGMVSKQYVKELVTKGKLNPYIQLHCGRIFLKSEVKRFQNSQKKNSI